MTRFFTPVFVLLVLAGMATTALAQGNQNDNFIFSVKYGTQEQLYRQEACGYGYSQFGASVQEELCAEIAWAYDITPDSIGCDTITMDLTGKFALIRRGACNFSIKAYYAQQAGAIGCLIVNHYDNAADDGCSIIGMAPGTFAEDVSIPCIFLCRDIGEIIDEQLRNGQTVEGCFLLPRVSDPFGAYTYATPVSQVDSLGAMGFNFINRSSETFTDLVIKADITGPNGFSESIEVPQPPIAPGLDTLLIFPPWLPPAVKGEFDITFTNNKYTEPRDTLRRRFIQTDYTFASDNAVNPNLLMLDGGADRNDLFAQGGFIYQTGALYFTGENGGTATYATFGIANIDSVYSGDQDADAVAVLIYDGDSDGDGFINLQGDWSDVAADVIGSGTYIMDGTETEAGLLDVEISDFLFGGPIALQPRRPYYVSLLYDGTLNGSGRNCAFTNSSHEDYLLLGGAGTTVMFLGQYYNGGWADRTIVQRLQMEGFVPGSSIVDTKAPSLDAAKFSITPNPGSEYVNLNLDLAGKNDRVMATLLSANGQVFRREILNNFQSGTIRFDVNDIPSGTYLLWVRTNEGMTIQKVAICH